MNYMTYPRLLVGLTLSMLVAPMHAGNTKVSFSQEFSQKFAPNTGAQTVKESAKIILGELTGKESFDIKGVRVLSVGDVVEIVSDAGLRKYQGSENLLSDMLEIGAREKVIQALAYIAKEKLNIDYPAFIKEDESLRALAQVVVKSGANIAVDYTINKTIDYFDLNKAGA